MPDAGSALYAGISGAGNDIARAMLYYHAQHQAYDQQYQIANALSRLGVSQDGTIVPIQMDEKGKPIDKTIKPIIDPKALEPYQARNQQERVRSIGALHALSEIGQRQINRVLSQTLSDTGLTGQLKQERILQSQSRTKLNNAQLGKVLGLIPTQQPLPTGGQILAEQRSLRKERFNQRKTIADNLLNQKVTDPQMLLGGLQFNVPKPGKLYGMNDEFVDPEMDDKGNLVIPKGAKEVQLDDGTKIPIKTFNRLYPQAQKWKMLGADMPSIKAPPPHDIQTLLADPSDQKKAYFDQVYGQGAADLVISAQGKQAAQPQQAPPVDTESAEDTDTTGEEEQTPSDAGGE